MGNSLPRGLTVVNNRSRSHPDEVRLLKKLFHGSRREELLTFPRTSVNDTLQVLFSLAVRRIFALDEVNEVLKLQFNIFLAWSDNRLRWNATEFGGLQKVYIDQTIIWKPELILTNKAQQQGVREITEETNNIILHSSGQCGLEPRFDFIAADCRVNTRWFPFDHQTCQLQFESWKYDRSELNVAVVGMSNLDPVRNLESMNEWTLADFSVESESSDYHAEFRPSSVIVSMVLDRKPLYYVFNFIVPCCLLSFIALSTFLLQPSYSERLALCVTILLSNSVYQMSVNSTLPTSSQSIPIIGVYFLFVTVDCMLAVAMTIIILHINRRSTSKPLDQMPPRLKQLVCVKLAGILRVMTPAPASDGVIEPPDVNHHTKSPEHGQQKSAEAADDLEGTTTQTAGGLSELRELMSTRLSGETEYRDETERRRDEGRVRSEWNTAAVVIDRLFSIIFAVLVITGTTVFFLVFSFHP